MRLGPKYLMPQCQTYLHNFNKELITQRKYCSPSCNLSMHCLVLCQPSDLKAPVWDPSTHSQTSVASQRGMHACAQPLPAHHTAAVAVKIDFKGPYPRGSTEEGLLSIMTRPVTRAKVCSPISLSQVTLRDIHAYSSSVRLK